MRRRLGLYEKTSGGISIGWTRGRPLLFIAEGLLIYFAERDVRALLVALGQRFPGAEMLLEAASPLSVALSAWLPSVRKTAARFRRGLSDPRRLAAWHPRIRLLAAWHYDRHPERWGGWCVPSTTFRRCGA